MLEFIKHALGICGEHYHPNLFTLILGGQGNPTAINNALRKGGGATSASYIWKYKK